MSKEAIKLQLIEKLLAVSDDAVLAAVDAALSNGSLPMQGRQSFKDFAGAIDDKDLLELEQIIERGCEQIHPDDWK